MHKASPVELRTCIEMAHTLYIKTHYYHWNVTGPMFNSLHLMFENQYNELATAVDDIAERIRSLGCFAPGTYHEFSRLTAVRLC
ncbi:DUF1382 family protein [Escherichia coli]|uniref:DUF1382 family protein n=1 Tax=Escherichia coli TaxID=562 RepID=UPI003B3BAB54